MHRFLNFLPVVLMLLAAKSASAQDIQFNPKLSLACYQKQDGMSAAEGCIGLSANRCMDVTPGGYSNRGMDACLGAEIKLWDGLLNRAYKSLKENDQQTDASAGGKRALALRDMQRAWIVFRDKTCQYEYAQWSGGSGAGPAFATCMMHMTGKQAMMLDVMRAQNMAQ